MGMYTPSMLLYWLKDVTSGYYPGYGTPVCSGGIKLLELSEAPLQADCLYITDEATLRQALEERVLPLESTLMAVSAAPGAFAKVPLPPQLTLIESSLPLISLYNKVHTHLHAFWAWDKAFHDAVYTNATLQAILDVAATQIHATILLLNPGFKHIAAVYSPSVHDVAADDLRDNDYLSFDTIQDIKQQHPLRAGLNHEFSEYISTASNNYTIIRLIHYQGNLIARLCIILDGPEENPAYSDMAAMVSDYIAEYMFNNQGVDYSGNADFGSLVADIIECRLTDPEELTQRLKQYNIPTPYHTAIISFNQTDHFAPIPWNYMISQLQAIFPFSNATVYRGDIILLLRKTKRASRVPIDEAKLLSVLEQYDCIAGIGNASEHISSLPPVYHQAKAGLRIGQVMDPKKRIFYYEDYSIYHIIELAAEASRINLSSRNLLHLCNNEIVALTIYDRKNDSDLVDTLYAYLKCGCNSTETAKALFIHRNTMLYKLKKIESIIDRSLDNSALQQRLFFSYHVLDFCKRYLGIDPMELKRTRPEDRPSS